MHKDSPPRTSVLQHVSQNVRRLRHAIDMSQATLAEQSGVSRRMLVAIEAGENNVSLTTLDRIAEALDVAFSDLIQAPDNRDPGRINELAWAGNIPGSKAVLLSKATATRAVEQWEWCLQPGEVYPSQPDAEGWSEQIFVFEGCLTLMLGDRPQRIAAGEFFMFASNQPHGYRNDGEVAARFVRNVVI
ncbi:MULTISPECIES: helix-turn-helix domain-containing protein [Pseudomonas]|uniref:XRE family transcriptional regulator n=1 Tax=Pseudomonas ekonensis TaxID=2842353 RepID=A0ABS6PEK0_9PSED|nr:MULTISPECIES: XRE family transcriptional regulator [unclassified Pseudomonas]MBV4458901.1 XRE family transcriptional regulator [Pseudomonas ekonensis]